MINKYEYRVLKRIKKGKLIHTQECISQLHSLVESGLVILTLPIPTGFNSITYHGCKITELGERSLEEYLRHKFNVALTIIGIVVAIAAIVVPIFVTQLTQQ